MTQQDFEIQLLALPLQEKARVIQLLAQSIEASWHGIEKTSGVLGEPLYCQYSNPCVGIGRVAVHGLAGLLTRTDGR